MRVLPPRKCTDTVQMPRSVDISHFMIETARNFPMDYVSGVLVLVSRMMDVGQPIFHQDAADLSDLSGIYIIMEDRNISNRKVVYIGQSKDLEQRFQQHCLKYPPDDFWYTFIPVENPKDRDLLERFLIRVYNPADNIELKS